MSSFFEETADLAGDIEIAEDNLKVANERLRQMLVASFGRNVASYHCMGREITLNLTVNSIAIDFPKVLFEAGFNKVIVSLSSGKSLCYDEPTRHKSD